MRVTAPRGAGLLFAALLAGAHAGAGEQSNSGPSPQPAFDAVSIRVTTERRGAPPDAPDRYYRSGVRLSELLTDAFGYPRVRIIGLPDWGGTTLFEVTAKAGIAMTPEAKKAMLQRMLIDRFGLRSHLESRELPYFALTAPQGDAKYGPRLSRTKEDCAAIRADRARRGDVGLAIPRTPGAERPVCGSFFYNISLTDGQRSIRYMTGGSTMANLADFLSGPASRVVVDRTGLTGEFDVDLEFSVLNGASADNQPSLATAVEEQLGLRLQSQRGPVDVLVIDAVSQPTDN